MSGHRFFVPTSFEVSRVEISGSEAHHLIRVLRARVGDSVELFDGQGATADAEIVAVSKNTAEVRIESYRRATEASSSEIVLATAIPKGDRFRWLVEKSTELGVTRLIPLKTEYSLVEPGDGKLKRMQHTVIEACKQCGRSRLMQIDGLTDWQEFIQQELPQQATFVAHPGAPPPSFDSSRPRIASNTGIALAVGPEGGFSNDEIQFAVDSGAKLIGLGPTLLRIETAAVTLAALFQLVHNIDDRANADAGR